MERPPDRDPVIIREGGGSGTAIVALVVLVILALLALLIFGVLPGRIDINIFGQGNGEQVPNGTNGGGAATPPPAQSPAPATPAPGGGGGG